MDETANSTGFPWDKLEPVITEPKEDISNRSNPDSAPEKLPSSVSNSENEARVGKLARPKTSAKLRLIYGAELKAHPRFSNAIDGKRIEDSALYFQVSPYAFARRSMMRTATVRTLLMDRKLPRLIDSHDHLMVIVTMEWVTGRTNPQSLEELGFNPEDYFDAE